MAPAVQPAGQLVGQPGQPGVEALVEQGPVEVAVLGNDRHVTPPRRAGPPARP